jgi:MoxR-like ATPase
VPDPIAVYHGLDEAEVERMGQMITEAFERASASVMDEGDDGQAGGAQRVPHIEPIPELIGIDPEVYSQINAALAAGFRHLLFYGPPGTGKTTLAQRVAGEISERWKLITGSSDFTSQDILGGYIPMQGGVLKFFPGVLLENFDKPLIFDELNRCDIDKVIGPLFTVLSGQSTTLPYLVDPSNPDSPRIEIRPKGVPDPPHAYAPTAQWKLIATINSLDKASLYQMSYALTRRFAWIYVDVPADPIGFVIQFIARERGIAPPAGSSAPLGDIWTAVNQVRAVGPAPIIDIVKLIEAQNPEFDFFAPMITSEQAVPYLGGFSVFLLPMLDGILRDEAEKLADSLVSILKLEGEPAARLRKRLIGLAI